MAAGNKFNSCIDLDMTICIMSELTFISKQYLQLLLVVQIFKKQLCQPQDRLCSSFMIVFYFLLHKNKVDGDCLYFLAITY
jgi:hypothetical protein